MAITQFATGSRTTSPAEGSYTAIGTDPQTTAGVYQLFIDVSTMANGDTLYIECAEKCTGTGDTQRVVFEAVLTNAQAETMFVSPSLILLHGWRFALKQTAGSARTLPWSIRSVA